MSSIETEPQPRCPVCGGAGQSRYEGLTDRLFGAPGLWNMKECAAGACGLLWLDPRPTRADVGKAYLRYYTHGVESRRTRLRSRLLWAVGREYGAARYGFATSRLSGRGKHVAAALTTLCPGLRADLELFSRYLPAAAMGDGRLLDVGCGNGRDLDFLSALGWRVSGVEVDPRSATLARGRGHDVREGSLLEAGFAAETFDAVTSSHVIEHVHDCRAFLLESRHVLKVGGTLVAVTPNARALTHGVHGRDWLALDPPRHLVLFTLDSLRALAESVGLKDVRVTSTARAVAGSHIASVKLHRDGHYDWGRWPGLSTWLAAQALQLGEPLGMKLGLIEGNELVLMATK